MTLEKIISKIKEQLKAGIYPGASLALYQAGKWQEFYFGLADPQEKKPTQAGLVYDLASVSKVVGLWQPFCMNRTSWSWICPCSITIRPSIEKM